MTTDDTTCLPGAGENAVRPDVLLMCRTLGEYLASALDRSELEDSLGRRFFPIIADKDDLGGVRTTSSIELEPVVYRGSRSFQSLASDSLAASIERCRVITEKQVERAAPCCVIVSGDEAAVVGASLALFSSRRLVVLSAPCSFSTLNSAVGAASSVVLVASPQRLADVCTDDLRDQAGWSRAGREFGRRRPWGLLTASSLPRLSALAARGYLRPNQMKATGVIYRMDGPGPFQVDECGLKETEIPAHPSAAIEPLTGAGATFATFVGHGRSYCAAGGHLCSLTDVAAAGDNRCVGDFNCVFADWPRIPARYLRADVVLIDSCATSSFRMLGPERDQGMNLGIHLVDGYVAAVIAPYRANAPIVFTPYVAWELLQRGVSLGEICVLLNEMSTARTNIPDPFVLIGDPEMRLVAEPSKPTPIIVPERLTDGMWRLHLPVSGQGVELFEVHDPQFVEDANTSMLHCVMASPAGDRILVDVLPSDRESTISRIIALWSTSPHPPSVELQFTSRPPFSNTALQLITEVLENLRVESRWLEADGLGDGLLPEEAFERSVESLSKAVERAVLASIELPILPVSQYFILCAVELDLISRCHAIGERLVRSLVLKSERSAVWLYRDYAEAPGMRILEEERISLPCCHCGASVQRRIYQVGLWPTRLRELQECEQCMALYDVELGHGSFIIDAPSKVLKGVGFAIRVRGQNKRTWPAIVNVAVVVDRMGAPVEWFHVRPAIQDTVVMAGEDFDFNFEIVLDKALPTHQFHIKAFACINASVNWALKKIHLHSPSENQ